MGRIPEAGAIAYLLMRKGGLVNSPPKFEKEFDVPEEGRRSWKIWERRRNNKPKPQVEDFLP